MLEHTKEENKEHECENGNRIGMAKYGREA
jgi:hypothetical protein